MLFLDGRHFKCHVNIEWNKIKSSISLTMHSLDASYILQKRYENFLHSIECVERVMLSIEWLPFYRLARILRIPRLHNNAQIPRLSRTYTHVHCSCDTN